MEVAGNARLHPLGVLESRSGSGLSFEGSGDRLWWYWITPNSQYETASPQEPTEAHAQGHMVVLGRFLMSEVPL